MVSVIKLFIRSSTYSFLLRVFYRAYEFLRYRRSLQEHAESAKELKKLFSDLTVRTGFMKGLKYPGFSSYGSSIFPKLSGTYESELIDVLLQLKGNHYFYIVDVGCAEGFYAVGLAQRFKEAKVFAFDISETAQQLCKEMAELNSVSDRVEVKQECTAQNLASLVQGKRSLIICDCEGYERHLFAKETVASLQSSDLIIELHPMHEKDVKEYLHLLLAGTHDIEYVSSYDDNRKIFDLPESYAKLSKIDKIKIVQEGRSFCMNWMIAKAKH
jgi:SAM-dependent methyltransferase